MMIRSLALFVHVSGVLLLFTALAVEWLAVELLRTSDGASPPAAGMRGLRALRPLYVSSGLLILASGIFLAKRIGGGRLPWVGLSIIALVVLGILGSTSLRGVMRALGGRGGAAIDFDAARRLANRLFVRASFRLRVGLALAVVYLMIAKPEAAVSAGVLAVGLAIGAASSALALTRRAATGRGRALAPGR